jgi:DNA-binding SARP family transcriptional activator
LRNALIERIRRASPRLLVVLAGRGWGKSFLAAELARDAASPVTCSFKDVAALDDARRRLAAAFDGAGMAGHDLVVLDDLEGLIGVGGAPLLEELVRDVPAATMLVLLARQVLPVDISRYVAPHEILTLRRADLAFTPAECREIIAHEDVPRSVVERAVDLCEGWPLATLLFGRIAREGYLADALVDLSSEALRDLHYYIRDRVYALLPPEQLAVLIACAAVPEASEREIGFATGFDAAAAIHALLASGIRYFRCDADRYSVLAIASGTIRAMYPDVMARMQRNVALALEAGGVRVRAARLALASGDAALACRALDDAGRHWPGEANSPDYDEIANLLPLELLFSSRNVFVEFFNSRRTRAMRDELHRRVLSFCETMSPDLDPLVRYSARIALCVTLTMTLQNREADVLARECLALSDAFPGFPERRELLVADYAANLVAIGAVSKGERAWEDEFPLGVPTLYEFQRFALAYNRLLDLGELAALESLNDANVEIARLWNDRAVLAYALAFRAVARIMGDPAVSVAGAIAELEAPLREDARDEADMKATRRFIRAFEDGGPFPTVTSCLIAIDAALGQTDSDIAERLIARAVDGFDRMGLPFWRIAGRLAAASMPGADRPAMLERCVAIAEEIDSPPLREQVAALARGGDRPGPYTGFLRRLSSSVLTRRTSHVSVNLIDCAVTRDGADVSIRQREFDLLIVLAMAAAPVSVEHICGQLWPEAEGEAATAALRMSVHRLRKQLAQRDAIVSVPAGYLLNPNIAVDLVDAERTLRASVHLVALLAPSRAKLEDIFTRLMRASASAYPRFAWYAALEHRLADLRHGIGMLLGRADLADGAPRRANQRARALLLADPLDEPAVELLVKSLIAEGDRAEAAREWRRYVRDLDRDLGTEPSIDLSPLFKPDARSA